MKKQKQTKYAKVGEKVRIIVPKLFVRCGYPLFPAKILEERKGEVNALMHSAWYAMNKCTLGKTVPGLALNDFPWWIEKRLRNMALTVILHREGFGGKERKIYEEETPEIKGATVEVIDKRFVRTGTYSPGWTNYSYWDEDCDWELPSLEDAKMHCVYEISGIWRPRTRVWRTEILAKHCERFSWIIDEVTKALDAAFPDRGE